MVVFPNFDVCLVSQPTLRREGDAKVHGSIFQGRKARGVTTNVYLRKTLEKPKCGLRTSSVEGSGVVFTQGEGISTPRACHGGRKPSIKCAMSLLQFISCFVSFHFHFVHFRFSFLPFLTCFNRLFKSFSRLI